MCTGQTFLQKQNHLKSPSWPQFDPNTNCEANIRVKAGKIIKAYIQDLSISDYEADEALTFIDGQDFSFNNTFTGVIKSKFAIETCSNQLKIQFKFADMLDYDFQCLPTKAILTAKEFTCGDGGVIKDENGFSRSPGYPSYDMQKSCEMSIQPAEMYGAKLFLLDLALRTDDCSIDFLIINGQKFCGSSLAQLAYVSTGPEPITIKYQSTGGLPKNQPHLDQRGFRIYFETYELNSLTSTQKPTTTRPFSYKEGKYIYA